VARRRRAGLRDLHRPGDGHRRRRHLRDRSSGDGEEGDSPVVYGLLRKTAEDTNIPFTVHAAGRDTSTDADAIHIAREGIATALVSIPNRYMHSPNEMVSLEDLDRAAELIAEVCRRVTMETDFTAR
jgi:putative aminopeptidase FrvX